jgi:chemotaxis protein methyltransferase CheR
VGATVSDGTTSEVERIEIDLLLEAVFRRSAYDFRGYAPERVERRVRARLRHEGVASVSALQERVLHEPESLEGLVQALSAAPSALFRAPGFFAALQRTVFPLLKTYPSVLVWNPACATGEEAVSLAILLEEAGIGDRVRIYATDISRGALEAARRLRLPNAACAGAAARHLAAGGSGKLTRHFRPNGEGWQLHDELAGRLLFAEHNLGTDRSFNEFNLVVCRTGLPNFGTPLRARAERVFYDSLVPFGFLALGARDHRPGGRLGDRFEPVDARSRIFRSLPGGGWRPPVRSPPA